MIDGLPLYVSVVFILTTILSIWLLLNPIKAFYSDSNGAKLLLFAVPFWFVFQGILAAGGFYLVTNVMPPRLPLFAMIPAVLTILALLIFTRNDLLSRLSLKSLTLIHVVRIPVEIVLWWLYKHGSVPQLMTFEGRNFDILAGLTAPIVVWLAFRNGQVNKSLLVIWNICASLLLLNILVNAVFALPTPFQKWAFDQPNVGVLHFPFVWLPAIIVPIVMFSHAVSLWRLFRKD